VPSGNPEKAVPESYASVTLAVTAGLPPLDAVPAVNTGLSPNTDAGRNDDVMEPPRQGWRSPRYVSRRHHPEQPRTIQPAVNRCEQARHCAVVGDQRYGIGDTLPGQSKGLAGCRKVIR
jgi:hypothetical protein